jgi:hypothetical protein
MPRMHSDLQTGVEALSSLMGERDAIAPVGTNPLQRMRAVLLILHHFTSSANGSLAPSLNSTLFRDVMAASWVQKDANWDGLPSSNLGQLNSLGRNTLETAFSFFNFLYIFLTNERSQKRASRRNAGRTATWALWAGRTGPAGCLGSRVGVVRFFACPFYFCIFGP